NAEHAAVVAVHDLHFHRPRVRCPDPWQGVRVDHQAGVALGVQVLPLQLQDVVLVHPLAAEHALGLAAANDEALAGLPRVRRAIDVDPAGQVAAVEQLDRLWLVVSADRGHDQHEGQTESKATHGESPGRWGSSSLFWKLLSPTRERGDLNGAR